MPLTQSQALSFLLGLSRFPASRPLCLVLTPSSTSCSLSAITAAGPLRPVLLRTATPASLAAARNDQGTNSTQGSDHRDKNTVQSNGVISQTVIGGTGLKSIPFPQQASLTGSSKIPNSLSLPIGFYSEKRTWSICCTFYTGLF